MDKFMKALDFDSDTLGNVKRDMNFVLQRLTRKQMKNRKRILRTKSWEMQKNRTIWMAMIMKTRRMKYEN